MNQTHIIATPWPNKKISVMFREYPPRCHESIEYTTYTDVEGKFELNTNHEIPNQQPDTCVYVTAWLDNNNQMTIARIEKDKVELL